MKAFCQNGCPDDLRSGSGVAGNFPNAPDLLELRIRQEQESNETAV